MDESFDGSGDSALRKENPKTDLEELKYVYPISVVERLTGLTRRRIRYYEEAGLVAPMRTPGRHRLFSQENVVMLQRIKALRDGGITTLDAVSRMIECGLDAGALARPTLPAHAHGNSRLPRTDWGDAAVRVMRPVQPRLDPSGKPGQSDSGAFFARNTVIPKDDKSNKDRR